MIPRMPAGVHIVAAIAAGLVVPYYFVTGQPGWALAMICLGALNLASARHA